MSDNLKPSELSSEKYLDILEDNFNDSIFEHIPSKIQRMENLKWIDVIGKNSDEAFIDVIGGYNNIDISKIMDNSNIIELLDESDETEVYELFSTCQTLYELLSEAIEENFDCDADFIYYTEEHSFSMFGDIRESYHECREQEENSELPVGALFGISSNDFDLLLAKQAYIKSKLFERTKDMIHWKNEPKVGNYFVIDTKIEKETYHIVGKITKCIQDKIYLDENEECSLEVNQYDYKLVSYDTKIEDERPNIIEKNTFINCKNEERYEFYDENPLPINKNKS